MSSGGYYFDIALLELYPPYTSVFGPYYNSKGRKHLVLFDSAKKRGEPGKTKTVSYPKALMEVHLGRRLAQNETVDHRDRDFTNDDISNLQVLTRKVHSSKDAVRVKVSSIQCPICGIMFVPTVNQYTHPDRPHFCSKRCAGVYSTTGLETYMDIQPQEITREYYREDKD